ncbi:MAG: methylenetetrahydrofolate--tRNA-(uracil(54)-C(5))-methyltransferase (FADH(2)-oxidizing) TrmFO [Oscillospiraceae bacterium]|nr:methylenetetrahydrofolate--tRNA-(uracil(54)-C(5))-methyltransferase (FADH(2)-oxidizing) TrmFO [Oscillospiraceae bacterium]
MKTINVIGAGLAGCEAAWQAAKRGVNVRLFEMKPIKYSPAHNSPNFAELVCSNSFRSNQTTNAVGLLKEELKRCGSLIMEAAYASEVPAGSALAVDRVVFSAYVTNKIKGNPNIEVVNEELATLDGNINVIATGPLTSDIFSECISTLIGEKYLHFYDAIAPIVDKSTIDMDKAFFASRYNKGEASYINCPMTQAEYDTFYNELINAEEAKLKDFDNKVFEGCMPVEVMARRGYDTLRFGPMKPVGITVPQTGTEAFAIVQLRMENAAGSMYNLVGFQTHLTFAEQKRVFRLIPGLENAEFFRFGVMHRNTFINSPALLDNTYRMRNNPNVFFAGQITGVEGYIESTASGFAAGLNAAMMALEQPPIVFPNTCMIGALAAYVSNPAVTNFQPMNVNFGITAPLEVKVKGGKAKRQEAYAERALEVIENVYK